MNNAIKLPVFGVDTHAHIFCKGLPLAGTRRYAPDYDATVEAYLENLRRSGLSHGVLVQPSFLGTDNSYMFDALKRHPDQLRGIAVVSPDVSEAELEAMNDCGVVGARLNLVGLPLQDYASEPWVGLFGKLKKLDWQLEIHRQCQDLAVIMPPILASGINLVLDHFGRPDPVLGAKDPAFQALLASANTGRVWVKLSGTYRNQSSLAEAVAMTAMLRQAFGTDHLLWGSDWPHTQFETATNHASEYALIDHLLPDPSDRQRVLVETPTALFRFK